MFRDKIVEHANKCWITPCDSGTVFTKNNTINIKAEISARRLKGNWQGLFMRYADNDLRFHEGLFLVRDPDLDEARKNGTNEMEIRIKEENKVLLATFFDDDKKNLLDKAKKPKFHGLNDCAHFASECFAKGGIKCGTGNVGVLLKQLTSLPFTTSKTLASAVPLAKANNIIASPLMQRGDALIYSSSKNGEFSHSAVYFGNAQRAMHTISNHPNDPKLKGEWTSLTPDDRHDRFTLIHFSGDDKVSAAAQALIAGQWTINSPAGPVFLSLSREGIAGRFTRKTTGVPSMSAAAERGYWFLMDRSLFICLNKTGTIYQFPSFPLLNPGSTIRGTMDAGVNVSISNG